MDEYDLKPTYVKLAEYHRNYLDKVVPDDRGKAIRIIIDSIINGTEQTNRKKMLDNTIMWSCFGAIFLFISYLLGPPIQTISIIVGTFLFAYGTIGGALFALSSTKKHR